MGSGAAMQTPRTKLFQLLFTNPFADRIHWRQPVRGSSLQFNKVTNRARLWEWDGFSFYLHWFFLAHAGQPNARAKGAYRTHSLGQGVGTNPALLSVIYL